MKANPQILRRERRLKLAAFSFVMILILLFFAVLKTVFISFLLSVLIVYLMKPAISFLERLHISKSAAIITLFASGTLSLFLLSYLSAPLVSEQFSGFQSEIPRYRDGIEKIAASFESAINTKLSGFYELKLYESMLPYAHKYFAASLSSIPQAASEVLTILILAPFFAFFMLKDGRSISRGMLTLVPNNLFEVTLSLTNKINEQVGGFIRARLVEALIVGLVVLVGLEILSFPYAVILAIFAGLTNLIPYLGPLIGAVPALLIAIIDRDGSSMIAWVTVVYLIAQVIDMVVVIPLVVAKIVNLHPVLVVLAIIAGAEVGGIIGMIISIPIASAAILILSTFYTQLLAQKSD